MIGWCMREGEVWGCFIAEGSDVLDAGDSDRNAKTAQIYDVGTQARIVDFDQADNGLLIVAQGAEKFTVLGTDVA